MAPVPDLGGRRILVTGASSGIGRASAVALARAGASVIAAGRRQVELVRLASELDGKLETHAGDLSDATFVTGLAIAARDADTLVNAAGVLKHAPFLDSDPADWAEVFDVNVLALLRLTQAIARQMAIRRAGHIISISSTLADQVYPFTIAYAATKHALRAICRGLRAELEPLGIRVTEIAPGFTNTAIRRHVEHPAVLEHLGARTPAALSPEEVARAVLYAVSAPAACVPELVTLRAVGST